jgi:hypothetical protein
LIIEVRAGETNQTLKSKYWTIFGFYDPAGALNKGRWRLPLYPCPTNLTTQMVNVPGLQATTDMELTIRIGEINDQTDRGFRADMALKGHY